MEDCMLKIGNVPVNQLVEQFGSPLYVYDVQIMQRAIDEYKKNFVSNNFATEILYASKAFTCKAMFKLIQQNNLSLDVVSGGEIYLASTINFDPKKLFFHGNNKPRHEMVEALKYGVGTFFVDNQPELDLLIQVSNELQISTDVIIRINPKVEAHTHDYVKTSIIDSKFGISMDYTEQIVAMINAVKNSQYLTMRGFHAHIGSQIFEYNGFEIEIDNMVRFMANINQLTNSEFSVLDLGGGFGVRYTAADQPKSYTETSRILIENVENACAKYHLNLTKLMIEPGRSIVGEAGYTVYTVGFTKKTDTKQ
jgi:diaminopimelate decarboxylase